MRAVKLGVWPRGGVMVMALNLRFNSQPFRFHKQVVHTCVLLLPSGIIWYRSLQGSDALRVGRQA